MSPQSIRQLERGAAWLATILLCAGTLGFTGCSREFRVPQKYKTIQAAIDAASARDVIMIEPGTYVENITINKPELTLRGTDPDASKVVIQARFGDKPVISVRERDVGLSNLTLTGGRRGIQIEASAHNPSLFNMILRGNSAQGLFVEGIASGELVESVVEGNGAAGVFIGSGAALRLEGNRIIGNYDGVETLNATLEIRANLVQGNARCGLNVDERSEVVGKDNVIFGNGQDMCGAARSRDDLLDKSPPPPPSNLSVTPSEWTSENRFTVDWENPKDIAGIVAYWFKVGTAPTNPTDGTRREIAAMPLIMENPPEGEQRVFVWLEDGMGNKSEQNCAQGLIKFDRSPPEIIPVPNPPPNANGWNNSLVTVSFECWDRASHVTACSDPVQIAEETAGRIVLGEAVDAAGNRAQTQITIKLDYTAPTVEVGEPQGELGDEGWYRSDVAVSATAADNLSGFADGQLQLEETKRTMREGEGLRLSFTVEDLAGNRSEAQAGPFKVDKAPPTIAAEPDRQPDSNGWYNRDVTVRFRCADTLSGISSCTSPVTVSSDGRDQAIQGEAVDKAGNRATAATRISLDKTPPTGSLTINDGAATTIEAAVTLHITGNDNLSGVTQMRFSNDGQTWSGWESFNSMHSNWDLSRFGGSVSILGPKTVYAQLRDAAGNESRPFSATVRLTLATFRGHSKGVRSVAFSPDGRFLASGSSDDTVKLWEVATGQEV